MNADPLSGYTIYVAGTNYVNEFGGTSCVAPMMAGFLALIKTTFTPLSFANVLYNLYATSAKSTCFKDITSGTNDNIKSSTGIWNCGSGYDYVTGLGSINGANLATAIKGLGSTALVATLDPVSAPDFSNLDSTSTSASSSREHRHYRYTNVYRHHHRHDHKTDESD